jgi:hypothetical protein
VISDACERIGDSVMREHGTERSEVAMSDACERIGDSVMREHGTERSEVAS